MLLNKWISFSPPIPYIYKDAPDVACADSEVLYGVELEIEHASPKWGMGGFQIKQDGSLRDNGYEYITDPMTFKNLSHGLNTFFKSYNIRDTCYSERTSIHIHTNCQDLELEKIASICLLYQVFEKLMYNYVGNDRDKNIFCTPWSETQLSYNLIAEMENGKGYASRQPFNWQKYTGLNLLPLRTLGTLEWRHMHGHNNVDLILEWANIIGCFYAWARQHTLKETKEFIIHLNSTSEYYGTIERVFGKYAPMLRTENYKEHLERGVIAMKYSLMQPVKNSSLEDYLTLFNNRETLVPPTEIQWGFNNARGEDIQDNDHIRPVTRAEINRLQQAVFIPEPIQPRPRTINTPPQPNGPMRIGRF